MDKYHDTIIDCVIELSNGNKRQITISATEDYIDDNGEEKIKNEILSLPENEFAKDVVYEKFYSNN